VPPTVFSRHDLDRLAPVGERTRGSVASAPPQSCFRRCCSIPDPNAGKDSVESVPSLTNAEIEHLHFGRRKQTDAKVFKKYYQMKLQMKREALSKLNRNANEQECA
jgi:hypothetical protein